MPITKPQHRARAITDAYPDDTREAQRQLDARDRWRVVATKHNKIVASIRKIEATHGSVEDLVQNGVRDPVILARYHDIVALHRDDQPLVDELNVLRLQARAGRRENLTQATRRILVERGVKPTQIAKATRPDRASAERSDTSERVTAHKTREKRRAQYATRLEEVVAERAKLDEVTNVGKLAADGSIVDATLADINPEYAADLDLRIADLKKKIELLSSRPMKKTARKPAKARRNRNV
jgi:hypothetical protein